MSSKHLSSDILALVQGALFSFIIVNPLVSFDPINKTVYDSDAFTSSDVAIVSGGGSGHKPVFAGFLSAAVAGSVLPLPARVKCTDISSGLELPCLNGISSS
ncbi:DAK1/DegV-like protein [Xylariaceae sp. AK1471]|nr:DAK1/DegV-like protein [Xylariaceae sp. AK1471]